MKNVKQCAKWILVCLMAVLMTGVVSAAETAGKGGGVVEAAGEGDLGDGVAGGAEHLNGHAKPVAEQVLFGRELLFFHEDPVEIGPVNAGIAGHVGNPDGISIIVFQIFFAESTTSQ